MAQSHRRHIPCLGAQRVMVQYCGSTHARCRGCSFFLLPYWWELSEMVKTFVFERWNGVSPCDVCSALSRLDLKKTWDFDGCRVTTADHHPSRNPPISSTWHLWPATMVGPGAPKNYLPACTRNDWACAGGIPYQHFRCDTPNQHDSCGLWAEDRNQPAAWANAKRWFRPSQHRSTQQKSAFLWQLAC